MHTDLVTIQNCFVYVTTSYISFVNCEHLESRVKDVLWFMLNISCKEIFLYCIETNQICSVSYWVKAPVIALSKLFSKRRHPLWRQLCLNLQYVPIKVFASTLNVLSNIPYTKGLTMLFIMIIWWINVKILTSYSVPLIRKWRSWISENSETNRGI